MKILTAFFLAGMILLNTFSNMVLYVSFKIHQDEIAKNICVLKSVKDNTCKGNCYLRKQLQKQSDLEDDFENLLKEKIEIVAAFLQHSIELPKKLGYSFRLTILFTQKMLSRLLINEIFQPPIVSLPF